MMEMIKFIFNEAQKNSSMLQQGFKRGDQDENIVKDEDVLIVKMFDYEDSLIHSDKQMLQILAKFETLGLSVTEDLELLK